MTKFLVDHWAALSFAGLYFFTAAVSVLPNPGDPRPTSEKAYEAIFQFFHVISNRVVERHPQLKQEPK